MFDAAYGDRDRPETWQEDEKNRIEWLGRAAAELIERPVGDAVQYLAGIRSEAAEFDDRNANGHLWLVYHSVARKCENPAEWIDALIAEATPAEFLMPFLDRLSLAARDCLEATISRLLQCEAYRHLAICVVLLMPTPNEPLLSTAFSLLEDPALAKHLSMRDPRIPLEVMARALEHANPVVRAAAAIGEWQREPTGIVRPVLEAKWCVAIRDVSADHYALNDVFEKRPAVAFDWLESQLRSGGRCLSVHNHALVAACKGLDRGQRVKLLQLFTHNSYTEDCFDLVLGDNIDLFAHWLKHQEDEYLRLLPLNRDVGPRWEQMALLALDAGVSPEELTRHCTPVAWAYTGPLSQYFLERIPVYEALASHPDQRLRPAGKRGLAYIRSQYDDESERERREDTYYS